MFAYPSVCVPGRHFARLYIGQSVRPQVRPPSGAPVSLCAGETMNLSLVETGSVSLLIRWWSAEDMLITLTCRNPSENNGSRFHHMPLWGLWMKSSLPRQQSIIPLSPPPHLKGLEEL